MDEKAKLKADIATWGETNKYITKDAKRKLASLGDVPDEPKPVAKPEPKPIPKPNLDINRDGVVDKKDAKLAREVLNATRRKNK